MALAKNNILGIDTATPETVIALNGRVVRWLTNRNQSRELLPKIDRLIATMKLKPTKLKGVVVNLGPGSFTGLRVGATIANGIGYGLGVPVLGLTEFDLLKTTEPSANIIIMPTTKTDLFVQRSAQPPRLIPRSDLAKWVRTGDRVLLTEPSLAVELHQVLTKAGTIKFTNTTRQQRLLAALAHSKLPRKFHQVLPVYLRDANITMPAKGQKPSARSKAQSKT